MTRIPILQPNQFYTFGSYFEMLSEPDDILGSLDRTSKQIDQDLNLYRVPADLEALLHILVGILDAQPIGTCEHSVS